MWARNRSHARPPDTAPYRPRSADPDTRQGVRIEGQVYPLLGEAVVSQSW
jgi:hypothetical protein